MSENNTAMPSYDELLEMQVSDLTAAGKTGNIANVRSNLRAFVAHKGKAMGDVIGAEFNADAVMEFADSRGAKSSRDNARSNLRGLLGRLSICLEERGLPSQFGKRLAILRNKAGISRAELGDAIGCGRDTIMRWENHDTPPTHTKKSVLAKAETILHAPPGALTQCVGAHFARKAVRKLFTAYGAKVRRLQEKKYLHKVTDWDESLCKERDALKHLKTTHNLGSYQRNGAWRVRADGACPSCNRLENTLETFYGYLMLPPSHDPEMSGPGLAKTELGIALLSVVDLLVGFLEQQKARAGCYTNGAIHTLQQVMSLVRPETGFLFQHPEFASHPRIAPLLPKPSGDKSAWQIYCEQVHQTLKKIKKSILPEVRKGRDPEQPIRPILQSPRPIDALFLLASNMEADLGRFTNPGDLALGYRDLLLVEMLTANPLRIGMYERMTWLPDNSGNLFQNHDGSWWIKFKWQDFKNPKGKSKEDYEVPVATALYGRIETYLKVHRPHLAGPHTEYLFRPKLCAWVQADAVIHDSVLSAAVRKATRRHLPNCPGFGPHAFRHIIATHLVKCYPVGGFEYAAYVLRDTLATIIAAYGHLRERDKISAWLHLLGTLRGTYENGGEEAPEPRVEDLMAGLAKAETEKSGSIKGVAHAKR